MRIKCLYWWGVPRGTALAGQSPRHLASIICYYARGLQIDLPFTPLGKALASGDAIRSWIRKNILTELQEYLKTGEVQAKKGIVHYFLDGMDASSVSQSEVEQQTMVTNPPPLSLRVPQSATSRRSGSSQHYVAVMSSI